MKDLIVLRGLPGSGKSTFVKEKKLEPYTLSPDMFRTSYQALQLTEEGEMTCSHKHEKNLWKHLFTLLEQRMTQGDFTVIDSTHTTTKEFTKYKQLAEQYGYRLVCVDFTHVPYEVALERNNQRQFHQVVPQFAMERFRARLRDGHIPKGIQVVTPETFDARMSLLPKDFSHYRRIHVLGDIHGCYQALRSYMPETLPHDELFVFVGDYVDRGTENGKVMNYLLTLMNRPNVVFLEGNHEIHLAHYSNDLPSYSKREFERYTKPDLQEERVSKKALRSFCRRLHEALFFTYNGKEVLVTHGGLPLIPENLRLISTTQLIKGVGTYQTNIDAAFTSQTSSTQYQVHGHRNLQNLPIEASPRSFNLEGKIEMGGDLRVVVFEGENIETHAIPNHQVSERFKMKKNSHIQENRAFLKSLRKDKSIQEKNLDKHVSSFNFKADVFNDSLWTEQNSKARGLFINTETSEIVARSYDKFFNIESYLRTDTDKLY